MENSPRYDFLDDHIARYSLRGWTTDDLILFFAFLGIGAFLCIGALGLTFRKAWARYLLQAGLILLALSWLGFLSFMNNGFQNDPFISAGVTVAILGSVIGALLFLNNADWVLPHFQKALHGEAKLEVLDQDVWEQKS